MFLKLSDGGWPAMELEREQALGFESSRVEILDLGSETSIHSQADLSSDADEVDRASSPS